MTAPRLRRRTSNAGRVAATALALVATGPLVACGPASSSKAPIPNAVDARLEWEKLEVIATFDEAGRPVDEIRVRGGDVVRITTDAVDPVEVGERVRSGDGSAETWTKVRPDGGALVVRATVLGMAVLVPRGTAVRAHRAVAQDPGFAWFELEEHVLAWAKGPLPAPFPAVAPPERIDVATVDALDRVLADAVATSKHPERARAAATAIRRVVGLRALRALRPPAGFPYFYDQGLAPRDAATRKSRAIGNATTWWITPGDPMEVTVEGPKVLQVWSWGVRRDDDETVKLRVMEGGRERAVSSAVLPHTKARDDAPEVPAEHAEVVSLRRAVVHVPPGSHTYRIEATFGSTFVGASAAKPVIHVGDAISGVKDEAKQIAAARSACAGDVSKTLCAIGIALAGDDAPGSSSDGTPSSTYTSIVSSLPASAHAIVDAIAEGAPRDPTVALELAAAGGDPRALAALGAAASKHVDDTVRAAWLRGTTRGTRWVVSGTAIAQADGEKDRWLSLLFERTDGTSCARAAEAPWTEIGADERPFPTTTFRGVPTLEMMAAVSCGGEKPITFEVDGEKLAANPSSALAKWHVLVRSEKARVKRTDGGSGKVFAINPDAAECGARWGFVRAPFLASKSPRLAWGDQVTAPGVEVWLREGTKRSEVVLASAIDPARRVRVVVKEREGFVAVDHDGQRWIRVARVGLPPWAAKGVEAHGGDVVAVRPILRAPKGQEDVAGQPSSTAKGDRPLGEAVPLDEDRLIALSRAILAADATTRGARYLDRALVLAEGGASRAAIEDARAAKVLGAKAPDGSDPLAFVRAAVRPLPRKPLELPASVKAYGLEPDFDDGAPRCGASHTGPRGKLAAILDELATQKLAQTATWDPALATRAFEAVSTNAVDPRGPSILSRALAGSRWAIPKTFSGGLPKVQRPHASSKEGPLDPDGDLRPRIGAGQPFDRASYATITESRPAKAGLTGSGKARARVEFACVARSPAEIVGTTTTCPIVITVGDQVLRPKATAGGRGSVDLPALPPKGKETVVSIGLDPAKGRWAAIARIVFDDEVPGATKEDGVGWVLRPPGLQWRWYLKDGQEVETKVEGPGLFRVDALTEPEATAQVFVSIDGKERPVPVDGEPIVLSIDKPSTVKVRSKGGDVTLAVAERVAKPAQPDPFGMDDEEAEPTKAEAAPQETTGVSTSALLDVSNPSALWRDAVASAPMPLTPLQEALGTVTVQSLGRYGNFRNGDPRNDFSDGYLEQSVGYRRRIESIGLWTGLTALARARSGNESFGASAFFWGQITPLRLRYAAFADAYGQNIEGFDARTIRPAAYLELSAKIAPSLYLLPRVGYDGFYTNLDAPPTSLNHVDDDVFNTFRFRRQSTFYQQLTAWWVPYFNEILFLRGRLTEDVGSRGISHAGARPGGLFAFGNLEIGAYADATWYRATPGLRSTSKVDVTGTTYALYNVWISDGSVDLQPGIGARARAGDGGYEVWAVLNIFASFRRGLRDFASPELAFPEQFGSNVPWRGPMVGGTR